MTSVLSIIKKAVGIIKKIFLVIAVYFVVISLFLYFINKDKPKITYDPIQKNREEIYKVINDKKLNSTKEGKLTIAIYRAMTCGFIGEACTDNPQDGDKNYNKSILGFVGNLIALPYANPPASGIYWAYSGLQNAGFVPKTYAAGIGFNSLAIFMTIWDAFRKLAYLILVSVIITIGFMIMFRMKLNPQTVISVENALPKIVITLILITFSYAIVGFLIDLMYLVIILGVEIISKPFGLDVNYYQEDILTSNMFNYIYTPENRNIYYKGLTAILGILPPFLQALLGIIWVFAMFLFVVRIIPGLGTAIAGIFGEATGKVEVVIAGFSLDVGRVAGFFIASLIAIIAIGLLSVLILGGLIIFTILFLAFRILFLLLSSLIQVILYLIFAPLFLLLEAVPGQSFFSKWLRNLVGNLIVFPLVIFLIIITNGLSALYISNRPIFTPPFLAWNNPEAITPLIIAVMLLIIPDLAKMLKQTIIGKGFEIPASPGVLFGAAGATTGAVTGIAQQIYYLQTAKSAIFGSGQGEHRTPGLLENLFKPFKKTV